MHFTYQEDPDEELLSSILKGLEVEGVLEGDHVDAGLVTTWRRNDLPISTV